MKHSQDRGPTEDYQELGRRAGGGTKSLRFASLTLLGQPAVAPENSLQFERVIHGSAEAIALPNGKLRSPSPRPSPHFAGRGRETLA